MSQLAIIYWSGTGNTEKMAEAVLEGAKSKEAEVKMLSIEKASIEDVLQADTVALGCPAMGDEVLEEDEMEPFIESLEKEDIKGKQMVLFGSYDWGDGEWMRIWEERMTQCGVKLLAEGLIVQNTPEKEELETCKELGRKIAKAK